MKIKRFFAKDMRQTIRQVREALGEDAVILSNRRVPGGVEVVAAIEYDESLFGGAVANVSAEKNPRPPTENEILHDENPGNETRPNETPGEKNAGVVRQEALDDIRYSRNLPAPNAAAQAASLNTLDESSLPDNTQTDPVLGEMQNELKSLRGLLVNQLSGLAWGQETRYHPLRARVLQRLIALGLSPTLAKQIAGKINEHEDFEHNWRQALGILAHQLPVANDDILNNGGVIAIVGPTGVGKTTTVAKLAARYTLRHGPNRVAMITTDNYRVAAHEQLRSYARIMGVPMSVAPDVNSLNDALENMSNKELVLIDTAGMSQRDMQLNEQLGLIKARESQIQTYLTLAANNQRGVLAEVTQAFARVGLAGCILTKLDETTSLGGTLAIAVEHNLPVAYISDGQRVPEDLHTARAHSLVSRSVAIMQQVGLASKHDALSLTVNGMVAQQAHG